VARFKLKTTPFRGGERKWSRGKPHKNNDPRCEPINNHRGEGRSGLTRSGRKDSPGCTNRQPRLLGNQDHQGKGEKKNCKTAQGWCERQISGRKKKKTERIESKHRRRARVGRGRPGSGAEIPNIRHVDGRKTKRNYEKISTKKLEQGGVKRDGGLARNNPLSCGSLKGERKERAKSAGNIGRWKSAHGEHGRK